jgi:D-lactate dehydrogenase
MKIAVYSYRPDELAYFSKFAKKYGVELALEKGSPSEETLGITKGCTCLSMIVSRMDRDLLQRFYGAGIRFISTRSIGYDHIDIKAAREIGMHVGNVSYTPSSVADYTVMLILMVTRKAKAIARHSAVQNFSLSGLQGVELHNLTIGIIGTGHIGCLVAKRLSAFDCRIIAYDPYQNDELKQYGEYVSLEQLFAESDLITIHAPATKDNFHLINHDTLARMKDGIFIVNTARGSIIDTGAFLDAVESGKVGGAALDVIEKEGNMYYSNREDTVLSNRDLAVLKSYPNVIVTPHTAFYTDQAVSDMVEHSLKSCVLFQTGKENPWQIV